MSDSPFALDDGYDDYGEPDCNDDEPDYEPDPLDDYEPDPTAHPDFEWFERRRYMARLSPLDRVRYRVSSFIWSCTCRWRIRRTAAAPYSDEPPF